MTTWVQKYGTPLYITSVADYTADFQMPALRAGGVDPKEVILVSADGNRSAYERIRAGDQYQTVTVSEPHQSRATRRSTSSTAPSTASRPRAGTRRPIWSRRRT